MDLHRFSQLSKSRARENKKFLLGLRRHDARRVDKAFHAAHRDVFGEINCMHCANCCKTTSPIFYPQDITRASQAVGMKAGRFVETYLRVDEDGDHVLKTLPCPFLEAGNVCAIYAHRPRACRDYPHTDRKKMVQVLDLTHRNTLVCPATLEIVERIKKLLK